MLMFSIQLLTNTSSSSTVSTTVDGAVKNVSTLAELISKYGITVVVVSVFIVLLTAYSFFMIKQINSLNERIEESNKSNKEMTKDLMNKILNDYFKQKDIDSPDYDKDPKERVIETVHEPNLVSGFTYASMSMNDASRIVMGDIHCERVGVYVFHNGNKTPFGFPFVKLTCINEFSMKGNCTTLRGLAHNNIPLHVMSGFVDALSKNGEVVIGNVYNHCIVYSDEETMNFISGAMVKALFALPIKTDGGEIAAFTIAEFKEEKEFSDPDVYNSVKEALDLMNQSIRSTVINEEFKKEAVAHRGST